LTMVSVWNSKKQGTACSVFYNPSYTYLLHSTVQSCKYVHFVNIPVIFMDMRHNSRQRVNKQKVSSDPLNVIHGHRWKKCLVVWTWAIISVSLAFLWCVFTYPWRWPEYLRSGHIYNSALSNVINRYKRDCRKRNKRYPVSYYSKHWPSSTCWILFRKVFITLLIN
jgi:hypothetical protein